MSRSTIDISYIEVSGSNKGGGEGVFQGLSGNTLNFKTLVAGTNISISANTDTIIINSSGGSGGDFVTNTKFNGYTGTTAPATYQSKVSINTLTGTTLPNTYQSKASINTLTGTTLPNTYQSKASINIYTGTTAPNQFASKSAFLTYTGTTAPSLYVNLSNFNGYTGTTQPVIDSAVTGGTSLGGNAVFSDKTGRNLRFKGLVAGSGISLTPSSTGITITSFSTGSTAAAGSSKQVQFNTGGVLNASSNLIFDATTGLTTNILKLSTVPTVGTLNDNLLIRNTSTGLVERIATSSITGLLTSNNGITKSGNNFRLGGTLTGTTTINALNTSNRLTFGAFPVQYTADYSANFNPRSLVDKAYVTGLTSSLSTTANNGLTKSGNNIRLGGILTGSTTISGAGLNLTFSNNAWTFGSRAAGGVGINSFTAGASNVASGDTSSAIAGTNNHAGAQYSSTLGGNNNKALAVFSSVIGGSNNRATGNGAIVIGGIGNRATGAYSLATGYYSNVGGAYSFVGGLGDPTFNILSSGQASFNFSENTAAQTFGHGALANNSVILGGTNHNIAAGNTGAVIVGRNGTTGIKLAGSSYVDHTVVNNLAIWTAPTAGAAITDDVLVWNATDKKVKKVTQASLGGGGGSPAGANTQVQFNNGGLFGASANFTFNTGTNTLSTTNLTIAGVPSVGSLSDNILIRNTGTGLVQTISTSSITGLLTSNNGITKSGNNFRLGGTLTGATTISGSFPLSLLMTGINIGTRTGSTGTNSLIIGTSNSAAGTNSVSIGNNNTNTAPHSLAIGTGNRLNGLSNCIIVGQNNNITGSSTGYLFGASNIVRNFNFAFGQFNNVGGYGSGAFGSSNITNAQYSFAIGTTNTADGQMSLARGQGSKTIGNFSYAGGLNAISQGVGSFASGYGTNLTKEVLAAGDTSFNHSNNDSSQVAGHGALGNYSAILGGRNHNIESGNVRSAIIGGNGIKLTGTTYIDTTAVANLAIMTAPSAGSTNDNILVRRGTTGKIFSITQASIVVSANHSNIYYVSKNGNDGTGQVNNISRPYLTIASAITAANAFVGKTAQNRVLIYVLPGVYSITSTQLMVSFVDIYFSPSTFITSTITSNIFQWNSGVDANIFGYGEVEYNSGVGQNILRFVDMGTLRITVEFKSVNILTSGSIISESSTVSSTAKIILKIDTVLLGSTSRFGNIGTGTLNSTEFYITFNELLHSGASSSILLQCGTAAASGNKVYINAKKINTLFVPAGTAFYQMFGTSNSNAYVTIDDYTSTGALFDLRNNVSIKFKGKITHTTPASFFCAIYFTENGGKLYLDSGTVITTPSTNSINAGSAGSNVYVYGDVYSNKAVSANVTLNLGTFNVTALPLF